MIFDTWGGALTPTAYQQFSLGYIQRIISQLTREKDGQQIPVVMFTKGGAQWLELQADTGCDAAGLDWTVDIGSARQRVGDRIALQGNMDPGVLYGSPEAIQEEVRRILTAFGPNPGHVFNLGHGIHQHIDPENVSVLVDTVHEVSAEIHKHG